MQCSRPVTVLAFDRQFQKRGIAEETSRRAHRLGPAAVANDAGRGNRAVEATVGHFVARRKVPCFLPGVIRERGFE